MRKVCSEAFDEFSAFSSRSGQENYPTFGDIFEERDKPRSSGRYHNVLSLFRYTHEFVILDRVVPECGDDDDDRSSGTATASIKRDIGEFEGFTLAEGLRITPYTVSLSRGAKLCSSVHDHVQKKVKPKTRKLAVWVGR